jgi:hypothetical protein
MNEYWYDIEGFPNYQISDQKRVRMVEHESTCTYNYPERIWERKKTHALFLDGKLFNRSSNRLLKENFTDVELESMEELWKPVQGFEGFEVSNRGRLKRLSRTTEFKRHKAESILTQTPIGTVGMVGGNPRKLHTRSVEKLYRQIVLNQDVTPKQSKHRRVRKIHF